MNPCQQFRSKISWEPTFLKPKISQYVSCFLKKVLVWFFEINRFFLVRASQEFWRILKGPEERKKCIIQKIWNWNLFKQRRGNKIWRKSLLWNNSEAECLNWSFSSQVISNFQVIVKLFVLKRLLACHRSKFELMRKIMAMPVEFSRHFFILMSQVQILPSTKLFLMTFLGWPYKCR